MTQTDINVPVDGTITPAKIASGDFYFDTDTLYVDSTNNRVGIGTSSPGVTLDVNGGSTTQLRLTAADSTSSSIINFGDQANVAVGRIIYSHVNDSFSFKTNNVNDRLILDSSGNLLIGTTDSQPFNNTSGTGFAVAHDGYFSVTRNGAVAYFNRNTSDGDIVDLRKDGSKVGSIGVTDTTGLPYIYIGSGAVGLLFDEYGADGIRPCNTNGTLRDNAIDLGSTAARFDDIYATNGTIQTSDRNEKQDIEALSDAEQRVAAAAKGLLRKFRWISSVEENGDDARIHFGIIAQDLQAAFEAEGLDAGRYAMFISSTWTDEETGEERSRMGVRYSELLAFIIAAI
jgi:hypothetical protein